MRPSEPTLHKVPTSQPASQPASLWFQFFSANSAIRLKADFGDSPKSRSQISAIRRRAHRANLTDSQIQAVRRYVLFSRLAEEQMQQIVAAIVAASQPSAILRKFGHLPKSKSPASRQRKIATFSKFFANSAINFAETIQPASQP